MPPKDASLSSSSHSEKPQTSRLGSHIEINDPLGQVLHLLQMKSVFYTNSQLSEPWGIDMPPIQNSMMFHLVVSGKMKVTFGDVTSVLEPGDFVIIPRGEGHEISGEIKCKPTPLDELPLAPLTDCYETLIHGGSGELCELICGAVKFEHPVTERLTKILPDLIVIDSKNSSVSCELKSILNLLCSESQKISLGGEAIITRLADILVIKSLREHLESVSDHGWVKALNDPRIGKAISLLHNSPAEDWSLSSLAKTVGMSRTAFTNQFKELIGQTPIDYLTEWRMAIAQKQLQETQESVLSIAMDVGYKSEAAFSRAFKKVTGKTPGETRKKGRASTG